ncbi:MAG: XdhC family protein [Desulfomonile sp.]|nr:XdhC family protein [Desulfomonile sp.]
MLEIWKAAAEEIARGREFVLATILSVQGACPSSVGTRFLVKHDGGMVGTIGGGQFEAKIRELALESIQWKASQRQIFSFAGSDVESLEMICGGEADVLIEFVGRDDILFHKIIRRLVEITQKKASGYLISEVFIGVGEQSPQRLNHALMDSGGFRVGGFPGCINLIESLRCGGNLKTAQLTELGGWEYPIFLEWIKPSGTVYIFGAGHVGICVAHLAAYVNFKVVVLDDRSEFACATKFPEADMIIVLDSFEGCVADLPLDEDSFVVIVTRGHAHDKTVLEQALRSSAGYIGMIGSRRKTSMTFDALLKTGFSEEALKRVHAPIGLNIGGETPQEIAVSIVGEMIQVRHTRMSNGGREAQLKVTTGEICEQGTQINMANSPGSSCSRGDLDRSTRSR